MDILTEINTRFKLLENEIESLKQEIIILKNDKTDRLLEKDYQKHLQKLFNGSSHLKNKYGITDITTDNTHIEIKSYAHYKHCLGQLIAYNLGDPKKHLIAALFGDNVFKERAIKLLHHNKINVWDITIINNELVIEKYPYIPTHTLEFIDKHLQKTDNPLDKIKLSELQKYTSETEFIPLIGYKLVNTQKLPNLHTNSEIKEILLKNLQVGNSKDYVKMSTIKEILKTNGIKQRDVVTIKHTTLKYIITDTFENVKFKERCKRDGKDFYNIFLQLKFKL